MQMQRNSDGLRPGDRGFTSSGVWRPSATRVPQRPSHKIELSAASVATWSLLLACLLVLAWATSSALSELTLRLIDLGNGSAEAAVERAQASP